MQPDRTVPDNGPTYKNIHVENLRSMADDIEDSGFTTPDYYREGWQQTVKDLREAADYIETLKGKR